MGVKVRNTYYSDREIKTVLLRKKYIVEKLVINGINDIFAYQLGDKPKLTMYEVFEKIVNKRLSQTKQEFLDSL